MYSRADILQFFLLGYMKSSEIPHVYLENKSPRTLEKYSALIITLPMKNACQIYQFLFQTRHLTVYFPRSHIS